MKLKKLNIKSTTEFRKYYDFLNSVGIHGHINLSNDYNFFTNSLINKIKNKKIKIFLIFENEKIINYLEIHHESNIKRSIIKTYKHEDIFNFKSVFDEINKDNIIEIGIRDNENKTYVNSSPRFKKIKKYNFMNLLKEEFINITNNSMDSNLSKHKFDIKNDLENLTSIQNECFQNHHGYEINSTDDIKKEINQNKDTNYIEALVDNDGIWAAYSWLYYNEKTKSAKLSMCGVKENFRNKGLAKIIISNSIIKLFSLGCKEIKLEVDDSNISAKKIYFELGFSIYNNLNWYQINQQL
jgi:ribosomal protein S18 acetylase RimI-like enzyme